MQELILAVPGLVGTNPKKATVITKAVGYVAQLKRKNAELQAMVKAVCCVFSLYHCVCPPPLSRLTRFESMEIRPNGTPNISLPL